MVRLAIEGRLYCIFLWNRDSLLRWIGPEPFTRVWKAFLDFTVVKCPIYPLTIIMILNWCIWVSFCSGSYFFILYHLLYLHVHVFNVFLFFISNICVFVFSLSLCISFQLLLSPDLACCNTQTKITRWVYLQICKP